MPAVDFLLPTGLPKVSARGPLMKNPKFKPSQPTPAVAPASSAKPFGDSPGPRGPPNPNLITDSLTTDTDATTDSEVLLPTPDLPLLTPKGLPKVSAERGPLSLTMVTMVINKLGLPSVLLDSLPLPMELVLMDTTGVEYFNYTNCCSKIRFFKKVQKTSTKK